MTGDYPNAPVYPYLENANGAGDEHACLWRVGQNPTDLNDLSFEQLPDPNYPDPANKGHSTALAINQAGVVVGTSTSRMSITNYITYQWAWLLRADLNRAVRFPGGTPILVDIPQSTNGESHATAINDSGAIAGWGTGFQTGQAFLWSDGHVHLVEGVAYGLNNLEHMIVDFTPYIGAAVWVNRDDLSPADRYVNLGTLRGGEGIRDVFAQAINDRDQIVGYGFIRNPGAPFWLDPQEAILWENGKLFRLTQMVSGLEQGHRLISATAISQNGLIAANSDDGYAYLLVPVELMVDANRDGQVSFTDAETHNQDVTSSGQAYRFWINDDNDGEGDGSEILNASPDYFDRVIASKRDLEDFTRLWISFKGITDLVKQPDIGVQLEWRTERGDTNWQTQDDGSPAVQVYRAAEPDGGTRYLTDDDAAALQTNDNYKTAIGNVTINGPLTFPANYFADLTEDSPNKYFLFEGAGTGGKGELVMTIKKNGQTIGTYPPLFLDIKNIKSMYWRGKAVMPDGSESVLSPYDFGNAEPPDPGMVYVEDPNQQSFDKPWDEKSQSIVFVHGWRMTYDEGQNYAETMYKRLWQRGYKGRFASFRWPTFTGLPPFARYNESEYRAWKCGPALKQFVASMPYQNAINLCAHSMGNIVAGSALKQGMHVTNYILMQAAIPSGCYNVNQANHQPFVDHAVQNPTPDGTADLGYRGYLENAAGSLVSFYNFRDDALEAWDINNTLFKPNRFIKSTQSYGYESENSEGRRCTLVGLLTARLVLDNDEAMPFVASSRTLTAGREQTGGMIEANLDLGADPYNFGDAHSAQWDRKIQQLVPFYNEMLSRFDIAFIP